MVRAYMRGTHPVYRISPTHMLCIIFYILLHPILRLLPSQLDKFVFEKLAIPSALRRVATSELRVHGDKMSPERALVIANHRTFYDFIVLLAIASQSNVELRFFLANRLVRFPTVSTWWQIPTTQNSINSAKNCWVVVFPERRMYSPAHHFKEQNLSKIVGSKVYRNLLEPSFQDISLDFNAIYDLTLVYGLQSGIACQTPQLDADHYCSLFVKRIDSQVVRNLKPRKQDKFFLKLWDKKDQHISQMLTK